METCPGCGKRIDKEKTVCECGELLRAEVTHFQGWETETVYSPPGHTARNRYIAAASVVAVIALTILALSLPQVRERFTVKEESTEQKVQVTNLTQSAPQSDLNQTEDLISGGETTASQSQEGVFVFASGGKTPELMIKGGITTSGSNREPRVDINTPSATNPYDAQLLSDKTDPQAGKKTDNKDASDCKPEVTVALQRPEPPVQTEAKTTKATDTTRQYTLGPRGGCFFVTAGGGKKYVDRSLCATTVAAARQ
jgi:hypothetical protein